MANLLIIDDDAKASEALAALLRREGHEAQCVQSAGAALTHLRSDGPDPDLVLLDLTMPNVDGLDLLNALSDEPRFSDLRVAVYSARDEPGSLKLARELGACDYILKGSSWIDTYRRIESLLSDPGEGAATEAPQG